MGLLYCSVTLHLCKIFIFWRSCILLLSFINGVMITNTAWLTFLREHLFFSFFSKKALKNLIFLLKNLKQQNNKKNSKKKKEKSEAKASQNLIPNSSAPKTDQGNG